MVCMQAGGSNPDRWDEFANGQPLHFPAHKRAHKGEVTQSNRANTTMIKKINFSTFPVSAEHLEANQQNKKTTEKETPNNV